MSILFGNLFSGANTSQVTEATQGQTTLPSQMSEAQVGKLLQQLIVGQAISGQVQSFEDGQLQLLLDDGSVVQAKVDSNLNLLIGQSMFFEVSASSDAKITLRPMFTNLAVEENAMKALDMANLPIKEETLQLVKSMMEYQMPIDKQSVMSLYKEMATFPEANPSTLVALRHFNIPITSESIMQFEQYQQQEHQLVNQVQSFINQVPDVLQDMLAGIGGSGQGVTDTEFMKFLGTLTGTELTGDGNLGGAVASNGNPSIDILTGMLQNGQVVSGEGGSNGEQSSLLGGFVQGKLEDLQNIQSSMQQTGESNLKLLEQLMRFDSASELDAMIQQGKASGSTGKELMQAIMAHLATIPTEELESKVAGAKEFFPFIKDFMKEQFLLKPEQVNQQSVEDLYKQLAEQTEKVMNQLSQFGRADSALGNAVDSLRQNIDFMNQVNQFASYVQIPLKMSNQEAHGELYVYANKKQLQEKKDNFTAVLQLDMDHIGMVNVSVTLQDNKVTNQFTLEDESSMILIEEHLDLLNEKLSKLGFQVESNASVVAGVEPVSKVLFEEAIVEAEVVRSHLAFDIRA